MTRKDHMKLWAVVATCLTVWCGCSVGRHHARILYWKRDSSSIAQSLKTCSGICRVIKSSERFARMC